MSFAFKVVRTAAKSPALLSKGPEVARKLTLNSLETICAKVVLPSPGDHTIECDPRLQFLSVQRL